MNTYINITACHSTPAWYYHPIWYKQCLCLHDFTCYIKFILSDWQWHIFCIDRLVSVILWSWDSCSQVSCHSRRHLAATIATVQCKLATGLPGLPDGRIQRFFFAKGESNGKHVSVFSVNAWAKGMVSIPSRIIGGHWWGSTSRSHRQWLQMFSSWRFWCFCTWLPSTRRWWRGCPKETERESWRDPRWWYSTAAASPCLARLGEKGDADHIEVKLQQLLE